MSIFKKKNNNTHDDDSILLNEDRDISKSIRNHAIIKALWISFIALGAAIAIFLLLVYNGVIGYMPPIEELEDPHDKLASVVYASDGDTELGRYFAEQATVSTPTTMPCLHM